MHHPLRITFQGMEPSEALEARIHENARRLEQFFDEITSCHVVVERPPAHSHKGSPFEVRIHIEVPGTHLDVTREPGRKPRHEDAVVAVRDAFDRAVRILEDYARKRRGKVKRHATPPHGRVIRMFPGQDSGFLESTDGLEVYFHRNAVLENGYEALEVGDEIRFALAPDPGEHGPQASTVRVIGKHHIVD